MNRCGGEELEEMEGVADRIEARFSYPVFVKRPTQALPGGSPERKTGSS